MEGIVRIELNQLQKDVLSNLNPKYKYIARQIDNGLMVISEKPVDADGLLITAGQLQYLEPIAHIFPEIKRGECFEIAELLKPEVSEEIQLTIVELVVLGALPEAALELERDDEGNLILVLDNDIMEDPIRKDFSMYNHLFEFIEKGGWFAIWDLLEKAKEQGLSIEMIANLEID